MDDAQQLEAKHKANEAETVEDEFFDMIDEEGQIEKTLQLERQ